MTIYTNKKLNHSTPAERKKRMDLYRYCRTDHNIMKTQNEKIETYQELTFDVKRIHQASKVSVIPIVTSALEIISKDARTRKENLRIPDIIASAQLSAILGAAHILSSVMSLN